MPKRYIPNDKWSQRAAAEGYRARSVYKLQQLNEKFRLLKPGMTVLDLGAAPGSWLQYTAEQVGKSGRAVGFDLQDIEPIAENVQTAVVDITDHNACRTQLDAFGINTVDLILSDLAPKTSGIRDIDQWRSIELSQAVLETAGQFLRPGGTCVLKVFRGADFDEFIAQTKTEWKQVKVTSVQASRDRSMEVYVVLQGRRKNTEEQAV